MLISASLTESHKYLQHNMFYSIDTVHEKIMVQMFVTLNERNSNMPAYIGSKHIEECVSVLVSCTENDNKYLHHTFFTVSMQ